MLSLTKKTDYALIALAYLAERPDRTVSAREIAGGFQMPVALVMNILKTLHHAKWLASTRGAKGGYMAPWTAPRGARSRDALSDSFGGADSRLGREP